MTTVIEELLRAAVAEKKADDYLFTRDNGKPIRDFRGRGATCASALEQATASAASVRLN